MTSRKVTVRVKDGEPVTSVFEYTKHNGVLSPVVERRGDRAYVVSIPMMHDGGLLDEQFYKMALAKSMEEFRKALEPGLFAVNLMAGSADGNTLYVRAGRIPIRPSGFDWSRPVPGNTSASAWKGVHPFEDLIRVENPDLGYMHNTNVAPDRMMASGAPEAEAYPAYLFNDLPGRTNSRGRRAIQMLENAFDITVEGALELALDEKWIDTSAWQDALRTALNSNPALVREKPADFRLIAHRILNFDGFAHKESQAALNYYFWRTSLNAMPDVPEAEILALGRTISTHEQTSEQQNSLLISALDRALERMKVAHGSVDLKYGDVFRAGRGSASWPLGGGGIPVIDPPHGGGLPGDHSISTMRAWRFTDPDENGLRWVTSGQYQTTLTIFTDPIQSFSALPLGQSADPKSPYYSNQAQLISERRLRPTYFYKEDLLKHVASEITLQVPTAR
jgi:acyl-homoserine lactone acylase PvdQ